MAENSWNFSEWVVWESLMRGSLETESDKIIIKVNKELLLEAKQHSSDKNWAVTSISELSTTLKKLEELSEEVLNKALGHFDRKDVPPVPPSVLQKCSTMTEIVLNCQMQIQGIGQRYTLIEGLLEAGGGGGLRRSGTISSRRRAPQHSSGADDSLQRIEEQLDVLMNLAHSCVQNITVVESLDEGPVWKRTSPVESILFKEKVLEEILDTIKGEISQITGETEESVTLKSEMAKLNRHLSDTLETNFLVLQGLSGTLARKPAEQAEKMKTVMRNIQEKRIILKELESQYASLNIEELNSVADKIVHLVSNQKETMQTSAQISRNVLKSVSAEKNAPERLQRKGLMAKFYYIESILASNNTSLQSYFQICNLSLTKYNSMMTSMHKTLSITNSLLDLFSREYPELHSYKKSTTSMLKSLNPINESLMAILDFKNSGFTEEDTYEEGVKNTIEVDRTEILKLEDLLESKETQLSQLRNQLSPLIKYRHIYSQIKNELNGVEEEKRELEIYLSDLEHKLKTINAENKGLYFKSKQIEQLERKYNEKTKENIVLNQQLANYQALVNQEGDMGNVTERLNEALAGKDIELRESHKDIETLKGDIQELKESKNRMLKRQMILKYIKYAFRDYEDCFVTWKQSLDFVDCDEKEDQDLVKHYSPEVMAATHLQASFEIPQDLVLSLPHIQQQLDDHKNEALAMCPILKQYQVSATRVTKTFHKMNVIQVFEEALDAKYSHDCNSIERKRLPNSFPQFFLDHSLLLYGRHKEMAKQLSQFIPTLYSLHLDTHPYGTLISKFMHLYDSDPILYEESVFLTKMNAFLNPVIEENFVLRLHIPSVAQNSRPRPEYIEIGGQAYLADVLRLFFGVFELDTEIGAAAAMTLKPAALEPKEYIEMRTILYIDTIQLTPDQVFSRCAGDVARLKGCLVHISEEKTIGKLTKPQFAETFCLKKLEKYLENETCVVSRVSILNALNEALGYMRLRDGSEVRSLFLEKSVNGFASSQFSEVIRHYDAKLSNKLIGKIYDLALLWSNGSEVTADGLYKVLLRFGVGKFKNNLLFLDIPIASMELEPIEAETLANLIAK